MGIECRPIRPSYVLKMQYARDMSEVLTVYWVKLAKLTIETYEENIPYIFTDSKMAFDANSNLSRMIKAKLYKKIIELNKQYKKIFHKLPIFYMNKVNKKTIMDVKESVTSNVPEDLQFLVVNFNNQGQRALIAKDSVIQSNVELITGIDEEMQGQVKKILQDSLMRGRDIDYMKEELAKIHSAKFSEKRIKLIARDQIDKATQVINDATLLDAGITEAVWKRSKISRVPRQSHLHANNTVYNIEKGCEIDGEFIQPAELYGCNCYSAPFIPGINSKTGNRLTK